VAQSRIRVRLMGPPQQLFKIVDSLTGKIMGVESTVMASLASSRSRATFTTLDWISAGAAMPQLNRVTYP
jgi:hypothetical protein